MVFVFARQAQSKVESRAVECYAVTLWINFRVMTHRPQHVPLSCLYFLKVALDFITQPEDDYAHFPYAGEVNDD